MDDRSFPRNTKHTKCVKAQFIISFSGLAVESILISRCSGTIYVYQVIWCTNDEILEFLEEGYKCIV